LSLSFFFQFSVCLNFIHITSHYFMLVFLFILTVGFLLEWEKGALD
jgi:NADH-quinone oxidoreductase subunit A